MQWDLSYPAWDELPWGQKFFVTGEAMSHLYHLVIKDKLIMTSVEGIQYFESA